MIKKNIIANFLGQGWSALMGLAFIPIYIHFLGIEAYGLIGLFAVMYALLTLLDMGMSPTLAREMARFTAGAHTAQSIRDLLRSLEFIMFGVAIIIGLVVWMGSEWLATEWLQAQKLPTNIIAHALSIMALIIGFRFCEGIYRSAIVGLQEQVWFNGASALLNTLRHGGAVLILAFVSPTVSAFFLWQAAISLLTVATYALKLYGLLPAAPSPVRFSRTSLVSVWSFAGGMIGINILKILLTQVDKVLLSRLLSLEHYGYYTLAGVVAGALYLVIAPITQAIFPRMVELHTRNDEQSLALVFHQGAQLVTLVTAPVMLVIGMFSGGVLYLWSGNISLADNTAPILAPLILGTFLNGLMWIPYQCQIAHGWTSLALKINIVAVSILVPTILWLVPIYGAVGAAWIWVSLNAGYVFIGTHFMYRKILTKEKWHWYFNDLLLPIGGAIGVTLLAQQLQPTSYQDRWHWFAFLLITGGLSLAASIVLADRIRPRLLAFIGRGDYWKY